MLRSLGITAGTDQGAYLLNQLDRTLLKNDRRMLPRTQQLIDALTALRPLDAKTSVLCVGCRNANELSYFRSKGAGRVVGIDLFSDSPDIMVMDMHELQFPDGEFDVVFACHSLEHSNNPQRAAQEFSRVCKKGGWIAVEVPIHFTITAADLVDFGSIQQLEKLFAPYGVTLHKGAELNQNGAGKACTSSVARAFLRK